jgi:hypothetical protein
MPKKLPITVRVLLISGAVALVAAPAAAQASKRAVIKVRVAKIGRPGNPPAAITPFTDAIYSSCAADPVTSPPCQTVGSVAYPYEIGADEVTVKEYVAFLNTADPTGRDPHDLFSKDETGKAWPKYGEIGFRQSAAPGHHYSVAYPEWADKPYGFANFERAARFANSLTNGQITDAVTQTNVKVVGDAPALPLGVIYQTFKDRLSPRTETGMYDMEKRKMTRTASNGFVIPSQDEWIKAAYFDPNGGGTYSYWKYPTNPGTFFDQPTQTSPDPTAPNGATLNPGNGNVTNSSTAQPLAIYYNGTSFPSWCPSQVSQSDCNSDNPFHLPASKYQTIYQGSLGTVGQARTPGPWGTFDQGGNAVEWTDTITPPPAGKKGPRVWRRLHGGVPNAPGYQLWLSAIGLQPQDNKFYNGTYPWLGFRVGVIGKP